MLHVANQVIENLIENIDCESSFQLRLFQYHQNAEHHSGQNTLDRQFYEKKKFKLHHYLVSLSRLRSPYWVGHCSMTNTCGLPVCCVENIVSPASHDI